MSLPFDAEAFVAEAERASNAYDWTAAGRVYEDDAVLDAVTDGARESFRGNAPIARAWRVYMSVMQDVGLRLEKRILAVAPGTITNDWRGRLRSGREARGVEHWRFGPTGLVAEHVLYTYLDVRPSSDVVVRARMLVRSPRLALSFAHAILRAR